MTLSTQEVVDEVVTNLLHPEFGTIYREPDGEAYLAYQSGLADGRAESTRRKKTVSDTNTTVETAESVPAYNPQPMSKAEAGVLGVLIVGILGGLGWAIKTDIKNQEERERKYKLEREERDRKAAETRKARAKWFDDQRKGKKIVLELRDGAYVAIPADAYAQAEIKKKGEWL